MTATKTPETKTETTDRCDPAKVKEGSVYSRHSFGTVRYVSMQRIGLRNEAGFEWDITPDILRKEFSFADQTTGEETVSRTRAIEVIGENSHTAMTVNFNKQVDPKAVAEALKGGQGTDTDAAWKKKVKAALDGEERTMIGYHQNSYDEHKRLKFTEIGVGQRLIDPRTVNYVIVNNVKYVVKS